MATLDDYMDAFNVTLTTPVDACSCSETVTKTASGCVYVWTIDAASKLVITIDGVELTQVSFDAMTVPEQDAILADFDAFLGSYGP